ncbi:unnamed protein product [Cochlearia groenlandica]
MDDDAGNSHGLPSTSSCLDKNALQLLVTLPTVFMFETSRSSSNGSFATASISPSHVLVCVATISSTSTIRCMLFCKSNAYWLEPKLRRDGHDQIFTRELQASIHREHEDGADTLDRDLASAYSLF